MSREAGKLLHYGEPRSQLQTKWLAWRLGANSAELRLAWLCVEYPRRGTTGGVERRIEVYRFAMWGWEVRWWRAG